MRIAVVFACVSLAAVAGCETRANKTYSRYGGTVIVTDAEWEREVGIAAVDVHRAMANWVLKDDGAKGDPTYKAGSRSWRNSEATGCATSYLEFTTADGHTNVIRTITLPERDIVVVLCESTDAEAATALCNRFASVLNARGFRPAG
jgi:hypothetical protein